MSMNIPEGYKKTEVGIIPDDWEVYYISEIAKKITDGEHATPKRTTEGYYLLSARNIHNGRIDLTDVDFVGEDEYQRIRKRCNPEPDDILLSCSGTIGRVSVVPSGLECVMVRSAALIKPDKAKVNSYFIQYILQSRVGQTQILQSLNQGAQANLFLNHIEGLKIPLPPLPEQKAIAQSLNDIGALITECDRLITKKRNIKQGTMQGLLMSKKRLPGFSGKWEVKKVTDLVLNKKGSIKIGPFGSQLKREYFVDTGYKVYGQENIFTKNMEIGDRYITKEHFNTLKSCELYPGDIILSMMGTVGKCMVVPDKIEKGIMDSHLLRLQLNRNEIYATYFSQLFYSTIILDQIKQLSVGGIMEGLSSAIIKKIEFTLPPLPEQKAIAQILSDMDAEIEALEQKRDKYKAIKQGMMQELLTGKTRLIGSY
ncbi:type I restriction-modification enzyme S subunit [Kalymmatonema gypsitolerans NIES-4073]|nr:type I restriction-modification enzyme S subunit [Scytonema sp. NIES-4073]